MHIKCYNLSSFSVIINFFIQFQLQELLGIGRFIAVKLTFFIACHTLTEKCKGRSQFRMGATCRALFSFHYYVDASFMRKFSNRCVVRESIWTNIFNSLLLLRNSPHFFNFEALFATTKFLKLILYVSCPSRISGIYIVLATFSKLELVKK